MIDELRRHRKQLDFCMTVARKLTPSREISAAITSLESGRMFLGKCLAQLNEENPYPQSKTPSNEIIEDPTDKHINQYVDFGDYTHIQFVKWLRLSIEEVEEDLDRARRFKDRKFKRYMNFAEMEICKGSMWLGAELGRIHATTKK